MIISWGKCAVETAEVVGGIVGTYTPINTPKEDTTKVTANAGDVKEAKEEGGGVVDARYSRNTYTVEFDLYVKKGEARPWEDDDGIIAGEHSLRIYPTDDPECEGVLVDRCRLRVLESYSTAEGKMLHYVGTCLRPPTGNTVKPYVRGTI